MGVVYSNILAKGVDTRKRPASRGDRPSSYGVSDGTRTRDTQDHNLVLYQLNYTHHVCISRTVSGSPSAASTILAG